MSAKYIPAPKNPSRYNEAELSRIFEMYLAQIDPSEPTQVEARAWIGDFIAYIRYRGWEDES